jgi:hypothetical protein
MGSSPVLIFHILTGTLGVLAGAAAVSFRKGSRGHGLAGNAFVLFMLGLSVSGIGLAVVRNKPGDILGGALTFYLVATAWRTARRRNRETGVLDWIALVLVLGLLTVVAIFALEAAYSPIGVKYGYSVGPYLFLGSVALSASAGDIRMLIQGGISGTQRIARHLWRMCFAFFIASASIFLARQHLFPALLRKSGALMLLSVLPLMLMIFWLIRVRLTRAFQERPRAATGAYAFTK